MSTKVGEVHLEIDDQQAWATVVFGGMSYQIDAFQLKALLDEWSEAVVTEKPDSNFC